MKNVVAVDVVERAAGRALISGPGFDGVIGREKPRRFYVEDVATETVVAYVRTYKAAARALARHHGLTNYTIEIDYED